jgi:hypothetical protein
MKTKRIFALFLSLTMLCTVLVCPALAADTGKSYDFSLTVNGTESAEVTVGDTVTVSLALEQTAPSGDMAMYAIVDKLRFNTEYFSLVSGSLTTASGVTCDPQEMSAAGTWAGWMNLVINALAGSASGDSWSNPTAVLSFKLKTLKAGTSSILQLSPVMSTETGMDAYACDSNSALVVIKAGTSTTPTTPAAPTESGTGGNQSSAGGSSYVNPFADVADSAWYFDAVKYVWQAKLFEGTGATTFDPEGTMTRAMFATVLHRYAKLPARAAAPAFTDVADGLWYSDAIAWAAEHKIVVGYGGGVFGPNDNITLEQMVTVLYRYVGASPSGELPTVFGDVSAWASDAMRWANTVKLFDGVGGTLTAKQPASRVQVAAFMANLNELNK